MLAMNSQHIPQATRMQLARLGAIGVISILQITGSPAGPACSVNVLRGRYRYQIICIHHSNNPYELHELIRRTVDARANKPPKSTPKAVFSNDRTMSWYPESITLIYGC